MGVGGGGGGVFGIRRGFGRGTGWGGLGGVGGGVGVGGRVEAVRLLDDFAPAAFEPAAEAAFLRYIRSSSKAQSFWSGGAGEVQAGPSTAGKSIFSPVAALNQNTR